MVLLFLVVVWLVVLGPSVLRRVRDRRETEVESVGTFHRELRILEHASPPLVPPAYRLRGSAGSGPSAPALRAKPVLQLVNGEPLPPPALAFLGKDPGSRPAGTEGDRLAGPDQRVEGHGLPGHGPESTRSLPAEHRQQPRREHEVRRLVRQRRRDTLIILLVVTVLSMIAGALGVGGAWILALVAGLSAVAYVWMLVNLRARADERERKLRYLAHGADRNGAQFAGYGNGDERVRSGHVATDWGEWDESGDDEIAVGYDGVDVGELWASRLSHPARAAR